MGEGKKYQTVTRQIELETKNCLWCGTAFTRERKALYCSKRCANAVSYAQNAEEIKARRRARYRLRSRIVS